MISGAFGSDCIRADSVELTAATVSASKKIRRAESTVASERTKYHAKRSGIERVIVRKRFAGGIIVSKSG